MACFHCAAAQLCTARQYGEVHSQELCTNKKRTRFMGHEPRRPNQHAALRKSPWRNAITAPTPSIAADVSRSWEWKHNKICLTNQNSKLRALGALDSTMRRGSWRPFPGVSRGGRRDPWEGGDTGGSRQRPWGGRHVDTGEEGEGGTPG